MELSGSPDAKSSEANIALTTTHFSSKSVLNGLKQSKSMPSSPIFSTETRSFGGWIRFVRRSKPPPPLESNSDCSGPKPVSNKQFEEEEELIKVAHDHQ